MTEMLILIVAVVLWFCVDGVRGERPLEIERDRDL